MHIDLIGCTGAGKTTLAAALVASCRAKGMEAWTSEDFAIKHLGFAWVRSQWVQRRVLEVAALVVCLAERTATRGSKRYT